jgi:ribosomal protein L7/L12
MRITFLAEDGQTTPDDPTLVSDNEVYVPLKGVLAALELVEHGKPPIGAIKVVHRLFPKLGLKGAKDMVDYVRAMRAVKMYL